MSSIRLDQSNNVSRVDQLAGALAARSHRAQQLASFDEIFKKAATLPAKEPPSSRTDDRRQDSSQRRDASADRPGAPESSRKESSRSDKSREESSARQGSEVEQSEDTRAKKAADERGRAEDKTDTKQRGVDDDRESSKETDGADAVAAAAHGEQAQEKAVEGKAGAEAGLPIGRNQPKASADADGEESAAEVAAKLATTENGTVDGDAVVEEVAQGNAEGDADGQPSGQQATDDSADTEAQLLKQQTDASKANEGKAGASEGGVEGKAAGSGADAESEGGGGDGEGQKWFDQQDRNGRSKKAENATQVDTKAEAPATTSTRPSSNTPEQQTPQTAAAPSAAAVETAEAKPAPTTTRGDAEPVTATQAKTNAAASRVSGQQTGRPDAEAPVDRVRFVQRVARAFEAAGREGGAVRMRLHPPELGSLRVEITVRNGQMTAQIEAETSTAKNLLLDNLPALRERLAEQNIKVERFDVQTQDRPADSSPDGRYEQQQPFDRQQQGRGGRDSSGGAWNAESESGESTPRAADSADDGRLNIVV
jgi:flagellar hook-length control protein FliK